MASEIQTPLTVEAYDRLDAEFSELVNVVRPEISRKIQEAREEGDLKENGGYHAAREEQGRVEARISKLEKILNSAVLTNGTEFNFMEDLQKFRLDALELCREVLLYEAIIDYANTDEDVDFKEIDSEPVIEVEIDSEFHDEDSDFSDKGKFNLKHVQYQRAMSRLQRIIETSSLKDSDHEFFKAQIDRSIFILNEATRLNSNFVAFAIIPEIKTSLLKIDCFQSEPNLNEVNELTFEIAKLVFNEVLKVLFPNENNSKVGSPVGDLFSLSIEESLETIRGAGELDNELQKLCSIRDALNEELLRYTAIRAIILAQGRVSGDSSLEMLDANRLAVIRQLGVINEKISYCLNRAVITQPDGTSAPSEVSAGSVITIDLNGKQMEFLLGAAEMAENTDLTVYSPDSPMGNAIMGAKIGDTVSYTAPTGKLLTVKIVAVSHFEG